jgi:alcohol dehydrogenase class IV
LKAFTFQAPPNILFEAGASRKLAELVAGYGVTRVLLVTDKGVRNAGLTKNAEKDRIDGGCELTVFEDVEADPPSHVIERAVGPVGGSAARRTFGVMTTILQFHLRLPSLARNGR